MSIPTGLDTGFFVLLAQNHELALRVWSEVSESHRELYTTDPDLETYEGREIEIVRLMQS